METDEHPGNGDSADLRSPERIEEALWVLRAREGDSEAFGRLMSRHERSVLYYLRRFISQPDAALDAHQEVWLDVYRGIRRLRAPEAFRAWLYRVAHAKAMRLVRDEIFDSEHIASLDELDEVALATSPTDAEAVHQALDRLSPSQREALTLHYLRDLSLAEIATATDCSVGTVKSRLHYARLALRRQLER